MKKLARWLAIAVLVMWLVQNPSGAAAAVHHAVAALEAAAHSLSALLSDLG